MKKQGKIQLLDIVPIFILAGIFIIFTVASNGATLSSYNLKLLCQTWFRSSSEVWDVFSLSHLVVQIFPSVQVQLSVPASQQLSLHRQQDGWQFRSQLSFLPL